ncbi:hypothetical protein ACJA3J_15900 [Halobacillus sp. SY10]|uniref:hypothetical protein n=1 Tax=Halobacillus sp. SY10 TaxID=3381356 RepID=UPI00387A59D6
MTIPSHGYGVRETMIWIILDQLVEKTHTFMSPLGLHADVSQTLFPRLIGAVSMVEITKTTWLIKT